MSRHWKLADKQGDSTTTILSIPKSVYFLEVYLEGRKYLLSCIVLSVGTILQSNLSLGSVAVYVATLIILLVYRTINVPQKIL